MTGEYAGERIEWSDSPGEVDGLRQWSTRICGTCGEEHDVTTIVIVDDEGSPGHEPVRVDLDCGHSVEPISDTIGHNILRGIEKRRDEQTVEFRDRGE